MKNIFFFSSLIFALILFLTSIVSANFNFDESSGTNKELTNISDLDTYSVNEALLLLSKTSDKVWLKVETLNEENNTAEKDLLLKEWRTLKKKIMNDLSNDFSDLSNNSDGTKEKVQLNSEINNQSQNFTTTKDTIHLTLNSMDNAQLNSTDSDNDNLKAQEIKYFIENFREKFLD
ncbi:MAG TPA: hypothetical protein GX497_14500 [Bacillus bacterium]|nr:hypothetical protein [Bacillus sp. (in: firmicutes)]